MSASLSWKCWSCARRAVWREDVQLGVSLMPVVLVLVLDVLGVAVVLASSALLLTSDLAGLVLVPLKVKIVPAEVELLVMELVAGPELVLLVLVVVLLPAAELVLAPGLANGLMSNDGRSFSTKPDAWRASICIGGRNLWW